MKYHRLFYFLKKCGIPPTHLLQDEIISASTLRRLRRNQAVSLYTLDKLSVYLGCSLLDLISGDNEEDEGYEAYVRNLESRRSIKEGPAPRIP